MADGRKIVFATLGSYGDLHPFIALALEMAARGWRPVVATSEVFRSKVESAGLEFRPMRPDPDQVAAELGLSPAELVRRMVKDERYLFGEYLLPRLRQTYEDARPVMEGAHLAVMTPFILGARVAADVLGVPVAHVALQPAAVLSEEDPPRYQFAHWLPDVRERLGPAAGRAAVALLRAASRPAFYPYEALRRRAGLPPSRAHPIFDAHLAGRGVLGLWSSLLGGQSVGVEAVGATAYDDEPNLGPDPELEAFLAAGAEPVVLTLGSFAGEIAGDFFRTGVQAARRAGKRVVVAGGARPPEGIDDLAGEGVLVRGYVRYSALFPRASVIVHHGGIGTTHQALRAGRPQLIAPAFGDQFDNAHRVRRLGAAEVVPLSKWTLNAAYAALDRCRSQLTARRAEALAAQVRGEDGARAAADRLEGGAARISA